MESCVVSNCESEFQELFRVPNAGSSRFKRWVKKVPIAGLGTERICSRHFGLNDFNEYVRRKLKPTAVPLVKLPEGQSKILTKPHGCSIRGCTSRKMDEMVKMPPQNRPVFMKWTFALLLTVDIDISSIRICLKHFKPKEFYTVRSRYLKENAIPSKHLAAHPVMVANLTRRTVAAQLPLTSEDNTCSKEDKPKSNRMCLVYKCAIKASNGVFLHNLPKDKDMKNTWLHAIKSAGKPKKNSVVCSQHFHDSDYLSGTKKLKKSAVPSLNLPTTSVQRNEKIRNELNPYKKMFEKETKSTITTSNEEEAAQKDEEQVHTDESANTKDSSAIDSKQDPKSNIEADIDSIDNVHGFQQLPFFEDSVTQIPATCHLDTNNNCMSSKSGTPYEREAININQVIRELQKKKGDILSDLLITDKDLNVWTGIPTMKILEALAVSVQRLEQCYPRKMKMHVTDRIVLTLARLKQNISFVALSTLFRVSSTTVSEYFSYTVKILAEILNSLIYWPSMEEISQNIPFCFRPKFSNVRCILDCTEIGISTPNCLNCRIACYSSYKHKRTAKVLLGVTPAGTISYCSRTYSGKASDKFIFNNEKFIEKLTKHTDEIMVDKGFSIQNECIENGIKLHIPPLLRNEQHSETDAILNESIAKARIHVERAISRIKMFAILQTSLDASILKHIDSIMIIICGLVNLSAPILSDEKF